jgi:5-deoxy-glucuronate isomerase
MPQLKFQYQSAPGLQTVVSPDNSSLFYTSLRVLQLRDGETFEGNSGAEEHGLVVMSGACSVTVEGKNNVTYSVSGRRDVFEKRSAVVYIPAGTPYRVMAVGGTPLEIAIGGALSDRAGSPALIAPEQLRYEKRGAWNWERHIYDSITTVNPVSQRLFLIEVYTPPGNWSSVPPHKHDVDNLPYESAAEEIYFYKMKPEQGFGFQRVYTDDRSLDEVVLAEHNSAVIQPRGYHPVANHPGYQMYYLNVIAGEKRALIPADDPQHRWLKDVEAVVKSRQS